ncbi:hypothetical protein WA026_017448 [Henosepilachna vigintioctopunctata]|uniref:Palmitoyltransferase n=1 Tax=Henosepilachna vigintioctopunctata TaxID=420089 RepID=A0AAW1VHR4_9CUCU
MLLSVDGEARKVRRQHGFQLPLHPLQLSGWLALSGLSGGAFLILIPALPSHLQLIVLALLSCLLLSHIAAHLAVALIDPAEQALREIEPQSLPVLDRTKHYHVIEHGFCNLCKLETTSSRTKHCSACNKCVAGFDHHCKWLNHCIGGRNYIPFLMCVSTALAAAAFVAILAFAELAIHKFNITTIPDTSTNFTDSRPSSLPTSDATFIAIVCILGILAVVTAGLLLHLCFFHIYISFLGLTTYEYIRQQRQDPVPETSTNAQDSRFQCLSNLRHRPIDLSCENRSTRTFFTCTVLEETFSSCAEPTPTPPSTPQDCQMCVISNNSVAPEGLTPPRKKYKAKWNCCSAVPDSPDDPQSPTEPRCLLSLCRYKKTKLPTIDGRPHKTHGHWSSAKLRVLFRVLGNLGSNRRRNHQAQSTANKLNQVVPAPIHNETSEVQTVNNIVPVPLYTDLPRRVNNIPALPPLPRRRLISEFDLANALTALQQQQMRAVQRRSSNQYRRRRRSVVNRTKTPALSPIRESGLSNPASPSRQSCAVNSISGACTRPF